MSEDPQRALTGSLLLERLELRRDIAAIKADLGKRAEVIVRLGTQLRSNPQMIEIDEQQLPAEFAQRAQKFNSEDFNAGRLAALVDELRKKSERLNTVEQEIKAMGYSLE